MPGVSGVTVVTNACAFYFAHAATGASSARHSLLPFWGALLPLFEEGGIFKQNSGASRGEIAKVYVELERRHCDPLARNDDLKSPFVGAV